MGIGVVSEDHNLERIIVIRRNKCEYFGNEIEIRGWYISTRRRSYIMYV